jgi:hypothetical protein
VEDNRAFKLEIDKIYGIIFAHYTHKLPHKIVTSSDFVTKIKNYPIALVGLIQRSSVSAVSTRHPCDLGVGVGLT